MDDIIKLLQELMSKKPTPKGGIADTAAGVDFIGKRLSKEQIGDFTIIGSRLTDASLFRPFSIRNVGRDNRYMYMRDYADELQSNFEKTLRFIQDNPDIRLTQAQKDNVFYNLGVFRRVNAEKNKLEKGYIDEGKNPEEIYKKTDEERPLEELPFVKVLERTQKTMEDFQKKVKETEDIFKSPSADELSAGQIRYKKLYNGPGYESGNSSLYRGYGSSFLPRLHEKGIIKLDDEIYQNLKQGKHHWGGADFFAPDPIRIWRKHFGDDVFKKLDNFDPDNEDIFQWATRNNVQPTNKVGPKNALEYMNSTEIAQRLTDEAELLNKYKDPGSAGENAKYYYADKPDQRMERISYHAENIQGYETALQKMDPEAYNKYAAEFRQKTNDANVIPFNKDEGILAVKSGAEAEGMLKDFLQKSDQISGENVKPIKEGQTTVKKDSLPIRLIKNINTELRLTDLTNEGYSKEQAEVLIKARNKMTSGEEINPNEALLRVKEEMADDAGVDVDELDFDFEIEEPEPIDEFAEGGRVNFNQGSGPAAGPAAGLASLTPYQEEYYNDKIIRDNMDEIKNNIYNKYILPNLDPFKDITDKDIYDEYDEREGYTSMFKKGFTTKDGKDILIPYKSDDNLDIDGLLEILDLRELGGPNENYNVMKKLPKEREV